MQYTALFAAAAAALKESNNIRLKWNEQKNAFSANIDIYLKRKSFEVARQNNAIFSVIVN